MSPQTSRALPASSPVGVIGAGPMGTALVQVIARAGHPVMWYDRIEDRAHGGKDSIAATLDRKVVRGLMTRADLDTLLDRVDVVETLDPMASCALLVDAISEDLTAKQGLFRTLDGMTAPDIVLATTTRLLSITAIGSVLRKPGRLVGLHWHCPTSAPDPAHDMPLVEIVSGLATCPDVADTMLETAAAWGGSPVHARATPGFIVDRVSRSFYAEALHVLQEGGAAPATLDAVLRDSGGFGVGPLERLDALGHDVAYAVACHLFESFHQNPKFRPLSLQRELLEAGWLGRKSGRGIYDYHPDAAVIMPETAEPAPAPGVITVEGDLGPAAALVELAEAAGLTVVETPTPLAGPGDGCLRLDDTAALHLTDGALATTSAWALDEPDLIAFDLALDYGAAPRIALAPADQASPAALRAAIGFFQALGKTVSVLDDSPGLIVFRTLCMLVNDAADAVNQGVADPADVDTAIQAALQTPRGPLRWADSLGLDRILKGLEGLSAAYGEPRYHPSPLLRRNVMGRTRFHG